jgi:starvation-inducible DNA-binding protein
MQSTTQNRIAAQARQTLLRIIDHVLKDEGSLSALIREYRWSVTGPNRYSLHRLFDEQRRQLDYWLEQLTTRARSVGFSVADTLAMKSTSGLESAAPAHVPARRMIGELLLRHESMAHQLRGDIERLRDPAMMDLLTQLVEFHETTAWMLRVVNHGSDATGVA